MISRQTAWREKSVKVDPEGRWLLVKGFVEDRMFSLLAIYAPNSGQVVFLDSLLHEVGEEMEGTVVIGGDLNCIFDPELDASKGMKAKTAKITKALKKT